MIGVVNGDLVDLEKPKEVLLALRTHEVLLEHLGALDVLLSSGVRKGLHRDLDAFLLAAHLVRVVPELRLNWLLGNRLDVFEVDVRIEARCLVVLRGGEEQRLWGR